MSEEKNLIINWENILIEADVIAGKYKREFLNIIKPMFDAAVESQKQLLGVKNEIDEIKKPTEEK